MQHQHRCIPPVVFSRIMGYSSPLIEPIVTPPFLITKGKQTKQTKIQVSVSKWK